MAGNDWDGVSPTARQLAIAHKISDIYKVLGLDHADRLNILAILASAEAVDDDPETARKFIKLVGAIPHVVGRYTDQEKG